MGRGGMLGARGMGRIVGGAGRRAAREGLHEGCGGGLVSRARGDALRCSEQLELFRSRAMFEDAEDSDLLLQRALAGPALTFTHQAVQVIRLRK